MRAKILGAEKLEGGNCFSRRLRALYIYGLEFPLLRAPECGASKRGASPRMPQ